MDIPTSDEDVRSTSDAPSDGKQKNTRTATRTPSIIVGIVAAVCVALIAYEFFRHRESRAWIRARRGEFTREEALRFRIS